MTSCRGGSTHNDSCRGGSLTSSCQDTELIREHFTRAGGAILGKPEQTLGLASAAQMFGSSSLISLWIWLTTSASPRRDGQNGSETASPKPGPGTVRLGCAFHSASFSRALRRGDREQPASRGERDAQKQDSPLVPRLQSGSTERTLFRRWLLTRRTLASFNRRLSGSPGKRVLYITDTTR
ncbi:hypothetical protein CesoFtcFv8_022686 [Champsocephalus esox]|uniref:Uncharacterized protein n=1 Tax=Champsocephalus esox TaxID=159716 RepID=A0AAN8B7Y6_9TELE|nr:hypothetical protein CesoFtcFv8_022686 [Champsocephalus esox]